MSLPLIAVAMLALLALGYTVYGRWIARQYALDDRSETPARRREDGVDFVPTRPFYLLGQHLSAIAAAGPIAGPILACQAYGWLPCLLWIGLGVIVIGSVHDFSALVASVRHDARSIAEIVRANLGPRAWAAIMGFIWITLVYVILAFADITAATFLGGGENALGEVAFDKGGAVAAASILYLLLAVGMGLLVKRFSPPLWLTTLVFVPATLGVVFLGTQVSTWLLLPYGTWTTLILAYCFVASLLPVWLLLQPRGYLGGFVMYLALAVGTAGVLFGGFTIEQPATTSAPLAGFAVGATPGASPLFPFLFVTIACGACSGFHGLVCSGTTSKQIARESHCRPVGYGAMLLEGFVAVIALSTVMILSRDEIAGKSPGTLYGDGIARFLGVFVGDGPRAFAATFGAMVFSTFVFDTLDVATRLGRYILQELTGLSTRTGAVLATAATAGVPLALAFLTGEGGYKTFWTLFGTANQLLAALTLLGITVWLHRSGRPCWFTAAPMLFVMVITIWSLGAQAVHFLGRVGGGVGIANGTTAILLLALWALLVVEAVRTVARPRTA